MHLPSRHLIDCHHVSTTGVPLAVPCLTPDPSERHVPKVVQLLDLSGVVREEIEEEVDVAPPWAPQIR